VAAPNPEAPGCYLVPVTARRLAKLGTDQRFVIIMPPTETLDPRPAAQHAQSTMDGVTFWLEAFHEGDPQAAEKLLPLVYEELRRLAASKMAGQPPGQTLQATALVHEAWLRLAGERHDWRDRRHFFAAAAECMRRVLVDRARSKGRLKRGEGAAHLPLEALDVAVDSPPEALLAVHDALDALAAEDAVKAELIKLRFFVGLRIPEAAEVLGISATTAKRHWTFARAWLFERLQRDGDDPGTLLVK
jgi:RNA polymerase sigma factor (TIGR02999 family)